MSLIYREQVLQAAHELYCTSVASQLEEIRKPNPYPQNWALFCDWVERLEDIDQVEIMWRLIGRVEQAWGYDVGLVMHHAGVEASDQARFLYYLLLGCMGTGLGLEDTYAAQMEKAAAVLLAWPSEREGLEFDLSPFTFEEIEWREFAETRFPNLQIDPRD